jgi:hypothetical protein
VEIMPKKNLMAQKAEKMPLKIIQWRKDVTKFFFGWRKGEIMPQKIILVVKGNNANNATKNNFGGENHAAKN